ncbi:MAG: phosphatidylinositol-specific phospholipase C/glycerophosphodiester phosphodiesterase family protein [Bacteroidia bacterium]|nr:phosphatidylinositol-specific phospholipase C/glycerophosphodiester phosphodiesterase family protein [Bacteroidia bacterium]
MKIFILSLVLFFGSFQATRSQQIHSHNDYEQNVPFWKAYSVGASSIEADVHLVNDTLFVAHDREEIQRSRTLQSLYLSPIRQLFVEKNITSRPIQLLIDIKTEAHPALDKIVEELKPFAQYLYPKNQHGVKIVISGSRPNPTEYKNYPAFIFFDWQSTDKPENPDKVALVSLNFRNFSQWNGRQHPTATEITEIERIINQMKLLEKPIRFWAAPDTEIAWKTLFNLNVDFIGTDKPVESSLFFHSLPDSKN